MGDWLYALGLVRAKRKLIGGDAAGFGGWWWWWWRGGVVPWVWVESTGRPDSRRVRGKEAPLSAGRVHGGSEVCTPCCQSHTRAENVGSDTPTVQAYRGRQTLTFIIL
uniref:Uncharacterized protein n=1 Tax=Knipowitschia caucasica TaxID=637954 RepID=A0AAV2MFV1_KNICA